MYHRNKQKFKISISQGIVIKSKETSTQLAIQLRNFWLPILQATLATFCVCSCKHNSYQLGGYMHACTNETHALVNLQYLISSYFGSNNYRQHKLASLLVIAKLNQLHYQIPSYFLLSWQPVISQLDSQLATCFLTFYYDPYFLFKILIVFNSSLFTFIVQQELISLH